MIRRGNDVADTGPRPSFLCARIFEMTGVLDA
jgi:hypothetical protein